MTFHTMKFLMVSSFLNCSLLCAMEVQTLKLQEQKLLSEMHRPKTVRRARSNTLNILKDAPQAKFERSSFYNKESQIRNLSLKTLSCASLSLMMGGWLIALYYTTQYASNLLEQ